jgi:hypothetical protein
VSYTSPPQAVTATVNGVTSVPMPPYAAQGWNRAIVYNYSPFLLQITNQDLNQQIPPWTAVLIPVTQQQTQLLLTTLSLASVPAGSSGAIAVDWLLPTDQLMGTYPQQLSQGAFVFTGVTPPGNPTAFVQLGTTSTPIVPAPPAGELTYVSQLVIMSALPVTAGDVTVDLEAGSTFYFETSIARTPPGNVIVLPSPWSTAQALSGFASAAVAVNVAVWFAQR